MAKLPPTVENCIVAFDNRGLCTMKSLAFADMLSKGRVEQGEGGYLSSVTDNLNHVACQ